MKQQTPITANRKETKLHHVCDCDCLLLHYDCAMMFLFYYEIDCVMIDSVTDCVTDCQTEVVAAACDLCLTSDRAVQTSHHGIPSHHAHGMAPHDTHMDDDQVTTEDTVDLDELQDVQLKKTTQQVNMLHL